MKKRIKRAFHGLIALLAVAVALLEAPELVTLTNNVANDPAPIQSTRRPARGIHRARIGL